MPIQEDGGVVNKLFMLQATFACRDLRGALALCDRETIEEWLRSLGCNYIGRIEEKRANLWDFKTPMTPTSRYRALVPDDDALEREQMLNTLCSVLRDWKNKKAEVFALPESSARIDTFVAARSLLISATHFLPRNKLTEDAIAVLESAIVVLSLLIFDRGDR